MMLMGISFHTQSVLQGVQHYAVDLQSARLLPPVKTNKLIKNILFSELNWTIPPKERQTGLIHKVWMDFELKNDVCPNLKIFKCKKMFKISKSFHAQTATWSLLCT